MTFTSKHTLYLRRHILETFLSTQILNIVQSNSDSTNHNDVTWLSTRDVCSSHVIVMIIQSLVGAVPIVVGPLQPPVSLFFKQAIDSSSDCFSVDKPGLGCVPRLKGRKIRISFSYQWRYTSELIAFNCYFCGTGENKNSTGTCDPLFRALIIICHSKLFNSVSYLHLPRSKVYRSIFTS